MRNEKLALTVEGLEEGHNLAAYAAWEAAKELERNWQDAIRDGAQLHSLANDVDQVIAILRAFKADVLKL